MRPPAEGGASRQAELGAVVPQDPGADSMAERQAGYQVPLLRRLSPVDPYTITIEYGGFFFFCSSGCPHGKILMEDCSKL